MILKLLLRPFFIITKIWGDVVYLLGIRILAVVVAALASDFIFTTSVLTVEVVRDNGRNKPTSLI